MWILIILSIVIMCLGLYMMIKFMEEIWGMVGLVFFVVGGAGIIVFAAIANGAI